MLGLLIRTRNGEYRAELDESDISSAIWFLSSPEFSAEANQVSGLYYFEIPVDPLIKGGETEDFEAGDVCWWPKVNAMVIFYGPTPLSGEDGKPVWKFPLIRIGRLVGDFSDMDAAGDKQKITLVQFV